MMKDVRELAKQYTAAKLSGCINDQVHLGQNDCYTNDDEEETVGVLSKAEIVRKDVENGMDIKQAIRNLAKRMRAFLGG